MTKAPRWVFCMVMLVFKDRLKAAAPLLGSAIGLPQAHPPLDPRRFGTPEPTV